MSRRVAMRTAGRVALVILAILMLAILFGGMANAADRIPANANRHRADVTRNARLVWGLDAPISAIAGQIHQESRFNPDAQSHAGALGIGQFMPATASWIAGAYASLGPGSPMNPAWAIRALVQYDRHLYDRVRKADTPCDRFAFALSAYNGGLGWVNRRQSGSREPGSWAVTSRINPGITSANQAENQHYPEAIIRRWQPLYLRAGWGGVPICA